MVEEYVRGGGGELPKEGGGFEGMEEKRREKVVREEDKQQDREQGAPPGLWQLMRTHVCVRIILCPFSQLLPCTRQRDDALHAALV